MAEGQSSSGGGVKGVRPVSTTSSQLSISDRMTDGDEEDNSSFRSNLLAQASSSCSSSLNLQQRNSKDLSGLMMARTTTISTIAMESNTSAAPSKCSPTRLVIALLQTPHRGLQLKVIELSPPLLKLPDNLLDADEYLKNHNQVIKNLQSKQSPVEELLRQADNLIATQKPRAEVYAAMADSLGQTWKDLNGILEERKTVIQLAVNAHKNISDCLEKIDKVHQEYSKINYMQHEEPQSPDQISDSLKNLKKDRADILKRVSQCLESCDKLLHKIAEFNYTVDSRELVLQRDVELATRQVHRWLERLHDRRIILEDKLKNKREQFEEFSEYSKHDKEIKDLEAELQRFRNFSKEFNFGEDVPSCRRKQEELIEIIKQLKILQEKTLLTAKRLEDAEYQRVKFYQRSGLKAKIYDILGQTNDILTSSIDLDLSFGEAKDFFYLSDLANAKLDTISKSGTPVIAKAELNTLTYDALSKGEIILDSYGWDSNKTAGVRIVHDNLLKKKDDLLEEIEHLEVLDEYNHFLECLNQAYQNILNIETSTLRQAHTLPVDLDLVKSFKSSQERTLEDVSRKLNLNELMQKLEQIYPNISEEEKQGTEEKINELKCLSNLIVELLIQRICVSDEWSKILEMYESEGGRKIQVSSPGEQARVQALLDEIIRIYGTIQDQLDEVHRSDPDLITRPMEERIEEMIKELQDKLAFSLVNDRIREICHKYKVKLDHHLFGESVAVAGVDSTRLPISQYYPVLTESEVAKSLHEKKHLKSLSTSLNDIIRDQLQTKLDQTLKNFFSPLVTSFRQEILDAQKDLSSTELGKKSQEEQAFERYCDRLKESYVTVTKEIQSYIGDLIKVCKEVEDKLIVAIQQEPVTVEEIQSALGSLEINRVEVLEKVRKDLNVQLERVLTIIQQEEPPIEAKKEGRVLRMMTSTVADEALEAEIQEQYDRMKKILTEKLIQGDLNVISGQLNDLISDLEQPCDYGDNLSDAKENLANFERFEKTVELVEDKLTRMLTLAGIPDTDEKAKALQDRLSELKEKRKRRKELIVLSVEYFRLIDLSKKHYEQVNRDLEGIRDESKNAEISIPMIEDLLRQLRGIKDKEGEQEGRLAEIERISKIIFADTKVPFEQTSPHEPLRVKNTLMTGELHRVESDLTELLGFIKSRSESLMKSQADKALVQQQQQQQSIPIEVIETIESIIIPQQQTESEFIPRSPGHEMFTQTSEEEPLPITQVTRHELIERELKTLSIMETLRQSLSPIPPLMVEKETQFEEEESETVGQQQPNRDTVTQTIDERNQSTETQTEGITFLSTATETIQEISEVTFPLRPISQEYLDPEFVHALKDLVVNEGDRVVLECRTTGQVKKLVWLKDGMDISNNPDYKTEFLEESQAKLSIEEVFHEDSAIFTCRAIGGENDSVVVETSGKLTVREPIVNAMQPPKFLDHPQVSSGFHGKPHVIQIRVEGNPLPTVQWFRNGECIDTSPDYIITFNNGLCEIQFGELLKDVDDGTYVCLAANKVGQAETQINLQVKDDGTVKKALKHKPKIIRPLPKHYMSRAGQKLKLEFEFESPLESGTNIVWLKGSKRLVTEINPEARVSGNTAALMFHEAYPRDSDKYTAIVENIYGLVRTECDLTVKGLLPAETSDDSELNVSDMETVKPLVKMPLKDTGTLVGSALRLDCVVVGHPEPEVIWYKNGTPLKESPNQNLLFHGDRCSLIIKQVEMNDGGQYSITAINSGGEATSSCKVQVYVQETAVEEQTPIEPPKFVRIIQDDMVTAGDRFEFVVELAAQATEEEPQLTWWKNNKNLEPSEDIEISRCGNTYSLSFKACKPNDKGNYMAKAANSGGDNKCFACLIVKENLERSIEEQRVDEPVLGEQPRRQSITKIFNKAPRFVEPLEGRMVDEGDTNVSLKCMIDANPPAELRWTKNNSSEPLSTSGDSNFEQMYSERAGDVALVIKEVGVGDGGRYSVTASNESGVAESSADLIVRKTWFRPVFSKKLQSVTIKEGQRLRLEIDLVANPAPEINWFTDGHPLSSIDPSIIMEMDPDNPNRHSLVIPKVISGLHNGEYKVTAKNKGGESSSSCIVTITEIPNYPVPELVENKYKIPPPVPSKPVSVPQTKEISFIQSYGTTQLPITTTTVTADSVTVNTHQGQSESVLKRRHEETDEGGTITLIKQEHSSFESRSSSSTQGLPTLHELRMPEPKPVLSLSPGISVLRPVSPLPSLKPVSLFSSKIPSAPTLDIFLEPGPEPEILVAPSPTSWKQQKNQVLEKVKTFQERSESPDLASPPTGGIRIVPQKEQQSKPVVQFKPANEEKIVNIPILPLQPFPFGSMDITPTPLASAVLIEPPKITRDMTSSTERSEYMKDNQLVKTDQCMQSQMSSSEFKFIKPSKFVPEKMRESNYESDFETTPIPPKWQPAESPTHLSSVGSIPTSSAFVSATSAQVPFVPLTSLKSTTATFEQEKFTQLSYEKQKPIVPPKPRASPLPQGPNETSQGVKGLIKSWPPLVSDSSPVHHIASSGTTSFAKSSEERGDSRYLSAPRAPSASRLSPVSGHGPERSRSPTPNKEALEMDKLWSKPIRFSSPSPSRTPVPCDPVSPPPHMMSQPRAGLMKPQVPQKPQQPQKMWSPIPEAGSYPADVYQLEFNTPNPQSTSKPEVPPKPTPKAKSPALYYVSSVSTPRTTPIPQAFSPPPDITLGDLPNFTDTRQYFEQSSSSYTMEETSSSSIFKQSNSSSSSTKKSSFHTSGGGDSGMSLLDQSMLPPPGEPPQFLFAPPPPVRQPSPSLSPRPQSQMNVPVQGQPGQVISSTSMSSSSSSSMSKVVTTKSGPPTDKQQKSSSVPVRALTAGPTPKRRVIDHSVTFEDVQLRRPQTKLVKSDGPAARRRPVSMMELVPYIKPSIFTPKLDYASSLEKGYSSDQDSGPIRPKWNPTTTSGDQRVTLTTWKRVQYDPPPEPKPRRNSMTLYVDKRMQDLNQKFKDNISQMSQGLCYNKLDRKVQSDLGDDHGIAKKERNDVKETVDANPLIYFKYDFGYEFGITDPRVVIRSSSEPPQDRIRALTSAEQDEEQGTIHLPIIHEKSNK